MKYLCNNAYGIDYFCSTEINFNPVNIHSARYDLFQDFLFHPMLPRFCISVTNCFKRSIFPVGNAFCNLQLSHIANYYKLTIRALLSVVITNCSVYDKFKSLTLPNQKFSILFLMLFHKCFDKRGELH